MLKTSNLTKQYILALVITAILSFFAYFNLNHLSSSQTNYEKMINIISKQKILVQKIAFYSIYYKINKLKNTINLIEKYNKEMLGFSMSDEIKRIYLRKPILLNEKIKRYIIFAKHFRSTRDGKSLDYLLNHSSILLKYLDKSIFMYLSEASRNTQKIKNVELYIFILTLLTLFFEAIFIFKPANDKIKKNIEELTKQKNYSNTVIESSKNAIITLDKNLKIKTYNKMAQYIFGYTKQEMINKPFFGKIVPRQYKIIQEEGIHNFLKELEKDDASETKENEGINKQGHIFPIRISFAVSGKDNSTIIIANIEDISKEKLNDQILQEQAKFVALGEMISIIAHQWRQPLAQLNFNCMYIRKILADNKLSEEIIKNEEIIEFMSETITNFENFYKKTDDSIFKPIFAIDTALKIVESTLKIYKIKLVKDISSDTKILGNLNILAQVILSILQNIIDIVKLNNLNGAHIYIKLKDFKDFIILSISDDVGGIKIKPIQDIFKPFKSKKRVSSTGIGLYMSKLIIEKKFNGTISADNTETGAVFTITLPYIK